MENAETCGPQTRIFRRNNPSVLQRHPSRCCCMPRKNRLLTDDVGDVLHPNLRRRRSMDSRLVATVLLDAIIRGYGVVSAQDDLRHYCSYLLSCEKRPTYPASNRYVDQSNTKAHPRSPWVVIESLVEGHALYMTGDRIYPWEIMI